MYADDMHLAYADYDGGNIESCFSEDLLKLHTWLNANKLTLSINETEFMLIGSGQMLSVLTYFPMISARVEQVLSPNHFV